MTTQSARPLRSTTNSSGSVERPAAGGFGLERQIDVSQDFPVLQD